MLDGQQDKDTLRDKIHTAITNNKEAILKHKFAACLHCVSIIPSEGVQFPMEGEATGVCPYCSVDTVIPGGIGIELNKKTIQGLANEYWRKESSQVPVL